MAFAIPTRTRMRWSGILCQFPHGSLVCTSAVSLETCSHVSHLGRARKSEVTMSVSRIASLLGSLVLLSSCASPPPETAGVRRECLDHVIILGRCHLANVLNEYCIRYFNKARPHQGIRQRIPCPLASRKFTAGDTIRSIPDPCWPSS